MAARSSAGAAGGAAGRPGPIAVRPVCARRRTAPNPPVPNLLRRGRRMAL